uniref:Transmembrane protein n=1 Tax=Heterorhabditis bacteriophora TaxID=37862 RepID=A0A1I7WPC9_HETBA
MSVPHSVPAKKMFITTTIAVIYFTVFLQVSFMLYKYKSSRNGLTIRLLLSYVNVEIVEDRPTTMVESAYLKYSKLMAQELLHGL